MRSDFVIVPDPPIQESLRVFEVRKPVGVQALVAKPAVEAFDVAVLYGLAFITAGSFCIRNFQLPVDRFFRSRS